VGIYPEGVRVPPENDGKAEEIEEKRATKKRKRKEKPNRVKKSRTAYNFFFKDELAHIRRLFEHRQQQSSRSVAETDISNDALLDRITNPNGTFNVHECRTVIGERWKTVDPQRLGRYQDMADEDRERYQREKMASKKLRKRSDDESPTTEQNVKDEECATMEEGNDTVEETTTQTPQYESGRWICPVCTLRNKWSDYVCSACLTPFAPPSKRRPNKNVGSSRR